MNHARGLLDRFPGSDRELVLGGLPVGNLAARYGTPLFVYDARLLDSQWSRLRATFPAEFAICYSVKANPNPVLMRRFLDRGAGLEIASAGELHLALRAGCPAQKILFAGPGKSEIELELALKHGIGEIHVESLVEAARVDSIAARLGIRAGIAVRINPGDEAVGGAMLMGGKPAPFGIDEECLDQALDELRRRTCLDIRGIHLFTGTQILDHETLLRQYRKGASLARRAAERLGAPLHTLDFGGGLGIPYFESERELDLDRLAEGLQELVEGCRQDAGLRETRLVIEPGRFLVGPAGVYITRVLDVKISRGKTFVVVDGGMNHHLAASGNLGQVLKRNFPVAVLTRLNELPDRPVDVVGPLCTPLDVLARDVRVPAVTAGDLVGVFQSGAYARAASPLGFLSHPTPPEVLVQEGHVELIRRRGTYEDMLADLDASSVR